MLVITWSITTLIDQVINNSVSAITTVIDQVITNSVSAITTVVSYNLVYYSSYS
jgi:hypothetical protein